MKLLIMMSYSLIFHFFLNSESVYACEEVRIREPISGFGLGAKLHPDYVKASQHNSKFPNLGTAEKKFCDGIEKIGIYRIYQTGAISLIYKDVRSTRPQDIDINCDNLSEPFKIICETAKNISEIIIAINEKQLNPSQKYVVLKELYETPACSSMKSSIARELSRLDSQPWLKSTAFELPVADLQDKYSCKFPVQESSNGKKELYVRLVAKGTERAFATLSLDSQHRLIKFSPLDPIQDISNLPIDDPCIKLSRAIANIPDGSPEAQAILAKKLTRLKEFDDLPLVPSYSEPSFALKKIGFVKQGEGVISDKPLHTNGMMPCVGVAVMNKETGKAFLIHADALTDVKPIFDRLTPQLGAGKLEAVIAGGDPSSASRNTLFRILESLDEKKIQINGYRHNPGIDGLAVDPRQGIFY